MLLKGMPRAVDAVVDTSTRGKSRHLPGYMLRRAFSAARVVVCTCMQLRDATAVLILEILGLKLAHLRCKAFQLDNGIVPRPRLRYLFRLSQGVVHCR